MSTFIIVLIGLLTLGFLLALILRVSSLLSVVKGLEKKNKESGKQINAVIMPIFGVLFLGTIGWYTFFRADKYLQPVASELGARIDSLFMTSTVFIGIIFVVTQILLFFFSYKYQYNPKRRAKFYPDNNKLEIAWTVIPAIVLVILVTGGLITWRDATSAAPKGANQVEIVGQQFAWYARYAGNDGELGSSDYRLIDETNSLGINFEDGKAVDDLFPAELHLEKGKATEIHIRSKDVLHSVSLPHFRMKMDAVPGLPTRYWVKPTKSTEEMRAENPEKFKDFELVCQQICGRGHFSMRLKVIVDEPADYAKWIKKQQTFKQLNPDYATMKFPKLMDNSHIALEDGKNSSK